MSGFAVMSRAMLEHPLFEGDSARAGAWLWLVLRACWKPTPFDIGGKMVTLERGQLCASRSQMAKAWGWSDSAVERFLTRLKTEHMIERATGQGKTIITICNYAKYQDVSDKAGQPSEQATGQRPDSDRTAKEQENQITIEEASNEACASRPADEAFAAWNQYAAASGAKAVRALSKERRTRLNARLKEHGIAGWLEAVRRAAMSEMLGRDPPGWFKFDFLIANETNILKVLEGQYDRHFNHRSAQGQERDTRDGLARYLDERIGAARRCGTGADDGNCAGPIARLADHRPEAVRRDDANIFDLAASVQRRG